MWWGRRIAKPSAECSATPDLFAPSIDKPDPGEQLLQLLAKRFTSYFVVQAWLDQNSIPHTEAFDSRA